MTAQIDRIKNAIRHIQTAVDVDPWAVEIAVDAMEKQVPKEPDMVRDKYNKNIWSLYCPACGNYIGVLNNRLNRVSMYSPSNRNICPYCGQTIDWTEWEDK